VDSNIRNEIGKFFVDLAKLIFAGAIVGTVLGEEFISRG